VFCLNQLSHAEWTTSVIERVAVSGDGSSLVTLTGTRERMLTVWDTATQSVRGTDQAPFIRFAVCCISIVKCVSVRARVCACHNAARCPLSLISKLRSTAGDAPITTSSLVSESPVVDIMFHPREHSAFVTVHAKV